MFRCEFDIAVFAANEAAALRECVASIDAICEAHRAHISVLLNGTTDQSAEILKRTELRHASMTVFRFPVADKANAINHFLYELRRDADVHFCIDGHVRISAGSLDAMRTALATHPHAHIASSMQLTGRSARSYAAEVMRGGAITGQLFAMRPSFVDRIVAHGFRLPLQIYRGDPLIGSMAAHDLDPMRTEWDNRRILGVAEAGFAIRPLSPFRLRDVKRQFQREIRQARGAMENEAIRSIIYKSGYGALPTNANQMLRTWLTRDKPRPRSIQETFFTRLALRHLSQATDIEPNAPAVLYDSAASTLQRG